MCIFCKIINNEVPCQKVYEDKDVLAFLDIHPKSNGHTLVVPKKHSENIFDIPNSDLQKVIDVAQKISLDLKHKNNLQGVNFLNSSGAWAGQEVMHYHLHIIPRYENDGL